MKNLGVPWGTAAAMIAGALALGVAVALWVPVLACSDCDGVGDRAGPSRGLNWSMRCSICDGAGRTTVARRLRRELYEQAPRVLTK